jgi:Tfp pilus assembly protein PilV
MNNKGQSILEAVVALSVAVVIVSAITVAIITSVNNADYSKNQNLATQYAQQGIEILRQLSESNWGVFSAYSGTYCLAQGASLPSAPGATGCGQNINDANNNPFFVRQVQIVQIPASQTTANCTGSYDVTVSVSWTDSKCQNALNLYCHQVSLDTCLANLNSVPTP